MAGWESGGVSVKGNAAVLHLLGGRLDGGEQQQVLQVAVV